MSSVQSLIYDHPSNFIANPNITSYTGKTWVKSYAPIRRYRLHTAIDETGMTHADFDSAFLPLMNDEEKRMSEAGHPPNSRHWRFEHWWHTEVSDVVLAAWHRYPTTVPTDHTNPPGDVNVPQSVESTYAMYIQGGRAPVIIGEMKRNLIQANEWIRGDPGEPQRVLSRELRGYAGKYQCPQVFCWDGQVLLILQFRAQTPRDIRDENCAVDCWVLPLETSFCTFRYALYRLMVQGLRRCQTGAAVPGPLTAGGLTATRREFFMG